MQTTLLGKGSKCRVCTHPDRLQIESMLARGAGIAAIRPMMQDAFSRRALYRHRAKHMIAAQSPAARPIPFPHDGSPVERVKWLQREAEHTAAMAEQRGNLGAKVKAIHEISRLIWLEQRLNQQAERRPRRQSLPRASGPHRRAGGGSVRRRRTPSPTRSSTEGEPARAVNG